MDCETWKIQAGEGYEEAENISLLWVQIVCSAGILITFMNEYPLTKRIILIYTVISELEKGTNVPNSGPDP